MKETLGSHSNDIEKSKAPMEDDLLKRYLLCPQKRPPIEELGYRIESGRFIDVFHTQANFYEEKHSLDALHSITDLDPKDAPYHPVREPARQDLILIVALLNFIEDQTNISGEGYKELQARYRFFSAAVGMINGITKKVRHELVIT